MTEMLTFFKIRGVFEKYQDCDDFNKAEMNNEWNVNFR